MRAYNKDHESPPYPLISPGMVFYWVTLAAIIAGMYFIVRGGRLLLGFLLWLFGIVSHPLTSHAFTAAKGLTILFGAASFIWGLCNLFSFAPGTFGAALLGTITAASMLIGVKYA